MPFLICCHTISGVPLNSHVRFPPHQVIVANPEGAALGDVVAIYQLFNNRPSPADVVVQQQALKFMFPAAMDADYLKTNTTTLK